MPVLHANGIDLHFQRMGHGPCVTMLHGLVIGNLAMWYFTLAPALSKTHQVLLYDLRGHGRSERVQNGYDLNTMVGDLTALLSQVPAGEVSLVGHSYGGLIALKYAAMHPERVSRLALVDVPLSAASIATSLQPDLGQEADLLAGLPASLQESFRRGGRRARQLLSSLDFLLRQSALLSDLQAEPDVTAALLYRIACPVLCLYGADSFFRADGDRYVHELADARLTEIPGGHYLPIESPVLVLEQLQEFLHG